LRPHDARTGRFAPGNNPLFEAPAIVEQTVSFVSKVVLHRVHQCDNSFEFDGGKVSIAGKRHHNFRLLSNLDVLGNEVSGSRAKTESPQ
jgi:hypothetical protein